ncbi:AraC family transcriptional regulator [Acinetobacter rudis]|uniref:helix-turn-helix transcriptional regulator n=1 Tax=Acinetobacter rudis TaxID=632955 RepID=UPI00280F3E3E|nr:AraC family transcriptional regulator [Acinetobacter rudis]MDQ8953264.1 AraC family transcriptional regulator [Acinetobacter rudis]
MSMPTIAAKYWTGRIALGYGIGYFSGISGDNQPHRHHAHQLSFPQQSTDVVRISAAGQTQEYHGVYIAANTEHQLLAGQYCSIYIDQTHFLADLINNYLAPTTNITELTAELIHLLRHYFIKQHTILHAFEQLIIFFNQHMATPVLSSRQQHLRHYLKNNIHADLSVQDMAQTLSLSTSRFSHWFSDAYGISYRSYRKWLRLIQTLQSVDQNLKLTDIAHQGHFSDQAHFSRTCKQMFGIQPSLLRFISEIEPLDLLLPHPSFI